MSYCWASNILQMKNKSISSEPFSSKSKFIFFMWSTLNFTVSLETKKKKTEDLSVGLDAPLGDSHGENIKKYIFSLSGIFLGKADSVVLLVFEGTINPQNLMKIVGAILEKIKIFQFFLMWTTLNFWVMWRTKKNGSRYLQEDPRCRIWMRAVIWFRPRVRKSGTLCPCSVM